MVTLVMVRAMGHDFSGALSVDFHLIHVTTNTLLSRSVIDPIINLVWLFLVSLVWLDPQFTCRNVITYSISISHWPLIATESDNML